MRCMPPSRAYVGSLPGPHGGIPAGRRLRIGPVVELPAVRAPAGRQPADIRPFRVRPLELLVRDVPVLVPVVFVLLGDAEVNEGSVPDVGKGHRAGDISPGSGYSSRQRAEPTRT